MPTGGLNSFEKIGRIYLSESCLLVNDEILPIPCPYLAIRWVVVREVIPKVVVACLVAVINPSGTLFWSVYSFLST